MVNYMLVGSDKQQTHAPKAFTLYYRQYIMIHDQLFQYKMLLTFF